MSQLSEAVSKPTSLEQKNKLEVTIASEVLPYIRKNVWQTDIYAGYNTN